MGWLWDIGSEEPVGELRGHEAHITYLSVSPQQDRIATGHENLANDVEFSADGARALTASYDGTARLWDVESGDC